MTDLNDARTVAALYIDPRGPYPKLPGVECWGLPERDAKEYAGPHPVVAHPPCGPWGKLRHLCRLQDPACGPRAVQQVRRWGGVLEHPAHSKLFDACGMPHPIKYEVNGRFAYGSSGPLDSYGGRTYYVEQCDWGHVARKATWLYVVGPHTAHAFVIAELCRRAGTGTPTHWISGTHTAKQRGTLKPGIKVASPTQARRTPPDFAALLVAIARRCAL